MSMSFFQENKSLWCSTTCIDPLSKLLKRPDLCLNNNYGHAGLMQHSYTRDNLSCIIEITSGELLGLARLWVGLLQLQ